MMPLRARAGTVAVLVAALTVLPAFFSGCGSASKRPRYLDDPRRHPEFGSKRYIKAVGISASSREEAELVARKQVSEQVLSSLQAVDSDRMREISDGMDSQQFVEYESVIESRTGFERAELIRTDPASAYRDEQGWYILAYLDRRALAEVVEADYLAETGKFGVFVRQARDAYRAGNACGVLAAWRGAMETFAELEKQARLLFIARDGEYAPHRENEERLIETFRMVEDLKQRMRFYVVMDGPRSVYGKERIRDLLQGFFEKMGLSASFCDDCRCKGPLAYRLRVKTREKETWGYLGPVCRLSVSATVVVCDTDQPVLELDLALDDLKGAHTSDASLALRNMYGQLDEAVAYQVFRESMATHFCLER